MSDLSRRIAGLPAEKRALLAQRLAEQGGAFNTFVLSFAQERLWFLDQLDPGSPLYSIPALVRLSGSLVPAALAGALDAVVRRHEALRTTFTTVEGRPVQVVAPNDAEDAPVETHDYASLQTIDLCDHPPHEREAAAMRLAAEAIKQPFDLVGGPLLRATLLRLADDEHLLLLIMHHIVSDGWSMGVLVREMALLYHAAVAGQPAPLAPLPLQYPDYAVWQRRRLQGAPLERQLAYWRHQLEGAPELLTLPTDRPRPPVKTPHGAIYGWSLPDDLAAELAALAQREGATLFMTLLAAFQVLLARYSGQDDIVVGSPVAGRTRPDLEGLIGFFVNTLALRTSLAGRPTFRQLLGRVREMCLDAFAHQDLPFEKLVEALQPQRDLRYTPLFQVVFALQNLPTPPLDLAGLTLTPVAISSQTAKFDLTLLMRETEPGLAAWFEYSTDLFDATTIAAMAGHFQTLLEGIAAAPDSPVSALPLLTEAERSRVLLNWNATQKPTPADHTIQALFEAQAARTPDALAIDHRPPTTNHRPREGETSEAQRAGWRGGEGEKGTTDYGLRTTNTRHVSRFTFHESVTYAELNRRANQLAHHLRRLGIGPDTRVGIHLERSPDLVVALLGILKAGGAYVPLDPAYPAERLRYMLEDAQVSVLLTTDKVTRRQGDKVTDGSEPFTPSPPHPLTLSGLPVVDLDADWDQIAQQPETNPESSTTPENLAYVIYTSGSTGRPKGVMVAHPGIANLAAAQIEAFGIRPGSRVLQFASPSFDAAVSEIFTTLLAGATLCMAPALMPGVELLRLLREQAITVVTLPPSVPAALPDAELPALETIVVAGEACPSEVVARWAPGRRFLNAYGPTEATVCATIAVCAPDRRPPPIGRPIANTQLYVLDQSLEPVPIGVPGELYIGGVGLARGYLGRPDLTAERFVPNPFSNSQQSAVSSQQPAIDEHLTGDWRLATATRLYRTGDLCRYRSDGAIEYLGRIDTQVKLRGFRIEPGEIEATLRGHEAVRDAAVVAREDVPGEKRLVAYIVAGQLSVVSGQLQETTDNGQLTTDNGLLASELRTFLKQKLPDYMVPAAFVTLEALPLTPSGKLDRRALPAPLGTTGALTPHSVPQSELERTIAAIWQAVLTVEAVGREQSFFELGGHSLLMVQVQHRLRDALGREIAMVDLFRYPTVGALARFLGGDSPAEDAGLRRSYERAARRRALAGDPASPEDAAPRPHGTAIAVIGMSGRFPGAPDVETFWRNLCAGVESISFFSDEELLASGISPALLARPDYVKAGGALDAIDLFDANFFGYSPREAEIMDPQQRLFLECAWTALEHAGYAPDATPVPTGIYAGVSLNHYWRNIFANSDAAEALGSFHTIMSNDRDFLTTRVSYKLNLRGPSINVQTACSTSLVAVHLACQALLHRECDMALAGGVSVAVPAKTGYLYHEGGIAAPDGHCRAFDARAQGCVSGSGMGIVVLKRLDDALADGDQIYALIKGTAINNDGAQKVGYTAPGVTGQAEVIAEALAMAGVAPDTIGYIEAHGTGTALGDPIEIAALTQAFHAPAGRAGFCALGSVKTNIGHLDAAAGVAGLIKTVLALKHGQLPPSLHFEQPNPQIDFAHSPFYVNRSLSEWRAEPRRAGVSSFGIGGTNAHVVLEEAPVSMPTPATRPWHLLILSAKTEAALDAATAALAAYLRRHPDTNLADVAYTLQVGRSTFNHRRALACRSPDDAADALEAHDSRRVLTIYQEAHARPVVFLFPGGGGQHARMGQDLYAAEPVFRAEVDRCAELLRPHLQVDLREILYPGSYGESVVSGQLSVAADHRPPTTDHRPQTADHESWTTDNGQRTTDNGQLTKTSVALPALFTVEYALARLWMSWGVQPQAMIGHSMGEYVAACLAGVFSLEDALELIAVRGRLMEQLPKGAMLSVALPEAELRGRLDQRLAIAAINGPALCVVSGPAGAIAELEQALSAEQVQSRRVQIDVAAHSPLVEPILGEFARCVERLRLRPPQLPWISCVTGTWITPEQATDPRYWVTHLRQTVRFADGIAELLRNPDGWKGDPERILLEVGPGQALSSIARNQAPAGQELTALASLPHRRDQQPEPAHLLGALGQLWMAGVSVNWHAIHAAERRRRLPLPTYPFERRRYWLDARHSLLQHAPLQKKPDMADWFYVPSWKRTGPPIGDAARPAAQPTRWLLFLDAAGLGAQLAQRLEQAGHQVTTVLAGTQFAQVAQDAFTLDPRRQADYAKLLAALPAPAPARIVHLWSVDPAGTFEQAQNSGFFSLVYLTQALERQPATDPIALTVITGGIQAVTGEEQLEPEKATLLGPARVIPQEHPRITCRCIDIALPAAEGRRAQLAEQLLAELASAHAEPTVAYRGSHRWVQLFEPLHPGAPADERPRLRQGGVYLITGGLGMVGLALADELTRAVQARLVLLGRTALPDRAMWEYWLGGHAEDDAVSVKIRALQALEQRGASVLTLNADVSSHEQMQAALARAKAHFGALHGVIHAAGALGEQAFHAIQTLGPDEAAWQFRPKAQGVQVLADLLEGQELDWCLLCSSLSTILGGLGFGAYAAANLFMDAFAQRQSQLSPFPWISVSWEGWRPAQPGQGGRLGADLAGLAISPQEGGAIFRRITALPPIAQVVVSTGDLAARIERWGQPATPLEEPAAEPAARHPRRNLPTPYVAPRNATEERVARIWENLLGIAPIGVDDNFFDLGGHSLLAVQLVSRLRAECQAEISLHTMFEAPTVAQLATNIAANPTPPEQAETFEQMLQLVEQLSEDEVATLLSGPPEEDV